MSEREARAKEVFCEALEQPVALRAALVARACGGDAELRRAVEELLAAHARADDFIAAPTLDGTTAVGFVEAMADGSPSGAAPRGDSSPGLEPPRIEGYVLTGTLGEGGFGTVYLAEQLRPVRRQVAVKVLKAGMDSRQVVSRFQAERQALAMMDHPGIARVFDAGTTASGRPYFVMERVLGRTLTAYCDENRLDTRRRLELFRDVCLAVQHAHQKGVIHRDLKPSNVLVSVHDGKPVPKVIDFGIAKAVGGRLAGETVFTVQRQMIGTPAYMSPEQAGAADGDGAASGRAAGWADVDTRTDVYSLGVLLYELLTGTTPFDATRLAAMPIGELQRVIRDVDPPKPSTRVAGLGETLPAAAERRAIEPRKLGSLLRGDLDWVVMKALEKDRSRRYESAGALAEDVRRFLADEPVSAGPPDRVYRLRKFARRNRGLLAATGAVLLALLIGLVASVAGFVRAERLRVRAEVKEARATRAAATAGAVNGYLQRILGSADPSTGSSRDMTMRQALDEAAAALDAGELSGQPSVKAGVQAVLGNAYLALGLLPQADRQLRSALALRREAFHAARANPAPGRSPLYDEEERHETAEGLAEGMFNLGVLLLVQDDVAGAEPLLRESLSLLRGLPQAELGPKASPAWRSQTAKVLDNLGLLLARKGDPDCEPVLKDALAIRRQLARQDSSVAAQLELVSSLYNVADLLAGKGKYAEAEALFKEALSLTRAVLPAGHPANAGTLDKLGWLLHTRGRPGDSDAAVVAFQEAIAIREKLPPPTPPALAASHYHLALVLQARGDGAGAARHARKAIDLAGDAPQNGQVLIDRAEHLLEQLKDSPPGGSAR